MVAHAFNPITQEEAEADRSEFKDSMVYKEGSRTDRATKRYPVLEKQKQQQKEQENISRSWRFVSSVYQQGES